MKKNKKRWSMNKWSSMKRVLLISCTILLTVEVLLMVISLKRSLPGVKEMISHDEDKLGYWLSKQKNHDDSLYIELYAQAIAEARTFEPSLHAFVYSTTESRDIHKQVLCEVLLTHAKTSEDSAFVRQTMLPPFSHASEYGFRKEYRQRVMLVKERLAIQ